MVTPSACNRGTLRFRIFAKGSEGGPPIFTPPPPPPRGLVLPERGRCREGSGRVSAAFGLARVGVCKDASSRRGRSAHKWARNRYCIREIQDTYLNTLEDRNLNPPL
jgi:hypothetical protein